jgi:CHAT domain-containing protein
MQPRQKLTKHEWSVRLRDGFALVFLCVSVFLVSTLFAQTTSAGLDPVPTGAVSLGDTLTGERCVQRVRPELQQTAFLQQYVLVCKDKSVGFVYAQAEVAVPSAAAKDSPLKALEAQFLVSDAYTVTAARMQCGKARWLEQAEGVEYKPAILALPCTLNNGGWPQLLLIRASSRKIYVAEGTPALIPVMLEALRAKDQPAPEAATLREQTRRLQAIWGRPIRLYNQNDLAFFDQLLAEARIANAQGKFEDSETLIRKALYIQTQFLGEDSELLVGTLLDLALNVSNSGRYEEAAALFRRIEVLNRKSGNLRNRARYQTYLGFDAANRREFRQASQYAQAARSAWKKIVDSGASPFEGMANRGSEELTRMNQGELAMALNFEALMSLKTLDLSAALNQAGQAYEILDAADNLPLFWKVEVLTTLGDISSAQKRVSAAVVYYKSALAYEQRLFGDSVKAIRILAKLGSSLQDDGLITEAAVSFRQAIKMANALPAGASAGFTADELSRYVQALAALASNLKDPVAVQGLYAEAFEAFQRQNSTVVQKTLARASARVLINNKDAGDAIQKLQMLERQRDLDKTQLASETGLADDQRSKLVEDALLEKIQDKQQQIATLQAQVEKLSPEYVQLTGVRRVKLEQLQSYLTPTEGVALFLLGNSSGFVQLIRRDSVTIAPIIKTVEQIFEDVKSLRLGLNVEQGKVQAFDVNKSFALYQSLLGGVDKDLTGLEHLIVVPSGPLASLPFSVLVTAQPNGADYANAAWLVKRVALTHSPSLLSFYDKRSTVPTHQATRMFLGFGNPTLGPASVSTKNVRVVNTIATSLGQVDKVVSASTATIATTPTSPMSTIQGNGNSSAAKPVAKPLPVGKPQAFAAVTCRDGGPIPRSILTDMPSLPDTQTELQTVSNFLKGSGPTEFFVGAQATEARLRSIRLSDYRILYFATHGLLPGELRCQSEPALVLSPPATAAVTKIEDGLLDASEISQMKLNADLVVLSACNTAGGGDKFGGEALTGLAEAFFFAGARNLLVTHWSVPSEATTSLMGRVFASLGPDMTRSSARALQQAQVQMLAMPATAHPVFWGAFVLLGDGAEEGAGTIKKI